MGSHRRRQPIRHTGRVRKLSKDRIAMQLAAPKSGGDIDAINRVVSGQRNAETIQERRIKVRTLDDFIAARAGLRHTRPRNNGRHADAPFKHAGLTTPERTIAGGCGDERLAILVFFRDAVVHVAAVVGSEDKDGLVRDAGFINRVQQRSNRIIQGLDHRRVGGRMMFVVSIELAAVILDQFLLGVERRVHGELPIVHEERFVLRQRFHPLHRLLGHAVFEVFVRAVRLEVLELPRRHETARRSRAGPVRDVHVEAVLQRTVRLGTEMPLAEMAGGVTRMVH